MSDTETSHRELIKALGGAAVVAEEQGVTRQAATNWMSRGVPWRYRLALAKKAKSKKVRLPPDFLGGTA